MLKCEIGILRFGAEYVRHFCNILCFILSPTDSIWNLVVPRCSNGEELSGDSNVPVVLYAEEGLASNYTIGLEYP